MRAVWAYLTGAFWFLMPPKKCVWERWPLRTQSLNRLRYICQQRFELRFVRRDGNFFQIRT